MVLENTHPLIDNIAYSVCLIIIEIIISFCHKFFYKMGDESIKISAKTWARTVDSIHKVRYSDGVVDGENSAFQSSFDMGYEEGFRYGFTLSFHNTMVQSNQDIKQNTHKFNCIICSDNDKLQENVMNLYNLQKESNNEKKNLNWIDKLT